MKSKITFELPESLRTKANRLLRKHDISMAELLRNYLFEMVKTNEPSKTKSCGSKSKC